MLKTSEWLVGSVLLRFYERKSYTGIELNKFNRLKMHCNGKTEQCSFEKKNNNIKCGSNALQNVFKYLIKQLKFQ